MKRLLCKLAIILLLGAIINVAVAWAFAAFYFVDPMVRKVSFAESTRLLTTYAGFNSNRSGVVGGEEQTYRGTHRFDAFYMSNNGFGAPEDLIICWKLESGWPMKCLTGASSYIDHFGAEMDLDYKRTTLTTSIQCDHAGLVRLRFGSVPQAPMERRILLPCGAIWPGFAINTIVYALLLWGLFAVPGYLKRRRRVKRGVCVRCAYPVGASPVCSECGTAVHGAAAPCDPRLESR